MKTRTFFVGVILNLSLLLALTTLVIAAGPGDLDPTFGSGGKVLTDLGGNDSAIRAVVLQPDGKIVVAGRSYNGINDDTALARYNSDGSLDPTFGSGGIVIMSSNNGENEAYSIVLQPDGKIIVAGIRSINSNTDFAVIRYNSNGSLDPTFGSGGIVTTAVGSGYERATTMALQSDGKIVVAGFTDNGNDYEYRFAVVRYNSNGSLDTSFDSDGQVITPIGTDDRATAITIQTNGKIVVAGSSTDDYYQSRFAVVRYNSNGSLDTAFDTDGIVTTSIGSSDAGISSIAIQPADEKIVVGGYSSDDFSSNFTAARYNSNGSLDTAFDTDGIVTMDVSNDSDDYGSAVALQANGKIIIAGYADSGNGYDFALTRYNSNGSLDTAFDTDGIVTTSVGNDESVVNEIALQSDGKIVAAGKANSTFAIGRYQVNGSLDTTFDADGKVITSLGNGSDEATAMTLQPDGKIIVSGSRWSGNISDIIMARYNSNGSLDSFFGNSGIVVTPLSTSFEHDSETVVQQDGKIVIVGGYSYSVPPVYGVDLMLVRYNSNGSLDTTFDGDGIVTTPINGSDYNVANAVALQTDGKIVVSGNSNNSFVIARYNSNGSLDTTFDGDGIVISSIDVYNGNRVHDLAIQSNGRIVVAGSSGSQFALVRYTSNGSPDTSFSGDGIATTSLGDYDEAYGVTLQSDGKIVAAGSTYDNNSGYSDFAIARYNSDGSLDTTFDGDGRVITSISSIDDTAYDVAIQSNGKLVVIGNSDTEIDGSPPDFTVVRYNSNGSLDTSFDTDGIVTTSFASSYGKALAVALQPDGKIVAAGEAKNDFALARYLGEASATIPAITVTKTASVSTAQVGQTITYTYRLTNTGSVTLTSVTANDDKLGAVTLSSTSLAPNIGANGTLTYTVQESDLPGPLTNTTVVTGTSTTGSQVTASAVATVTLQSQTESQFDAYLPLVIKP